MIKFLVSTSYRRKGKSYDISVRIPEIEASDWAVAIGRAARIVKASLRRGERVEQVSIRIQPQARLGGRHATEEE